MRKHILIVSLLIVLVAAGFYFYLSRPDEARLSVAAVSGRIPEITPPRNQVIPTVEIADAVGWPEGGKPTPAPGLAVNAFAGGLDHPRWLYQLPNGDVLVAESQGPPSAGGGIKGWIERHLMRKAGAGGVSADRITLLRDADRDGVAEARSVLVSGLHSPFGMALVGPWLYVANTDALVRFPYRLGQTRITAKPQTVMELPHNGGHWTRNVIPTPDGKNLFVTVGSSTNIADNGMDAEVNRANIIEVDPDHGTSRIYAGGLRNPNGMAYEPTTGRLFTVVNERDMLGSDVPPDYLTEIELGDFFGWPYSYWGGYVDKRVDPERPDLLQYTKRPDYALGPHVAALGLAFAGNTKLGDKFADGAFVGEHGSWNRQPLSGYKVVFVPFANGFPQSGAKPVDVLTGFLSDDGKAHGRPVGVIAGAEGGLLVADDVGNTIWRVTAG